MQWRDNKCNVHMFQCITASLGFTKNQLTAGPRLLYALYGLKLKAVRTRLLPFIVLENFSLCEITFAT